MRVRRAQRGVGAGLQPDQHLAELVVGGLIVALVSPEDPPQQAQQRQFDAQECDDDPDGERGGVARICNDDRDRRADGDDQPAEECNPEQAHPAQLAVGIHREPCQQSCQWTLRLGVLCHAQRIAPDRCSLWARRPVRTNAPRQSAGLPAVVNSASMFTAPMRGPLFGRGHGPGPRGRHARGLQRECGRTRG